MQIRILQESDAQAYQEIRLSSLQINPESFGSTYDSEVRYSQETIVERIKPTKDKFVLGAFDGNDSLVGIVTFMREKSFKTAHKGNVYGMYVVQEMRGQGLAKSLMLELIRITGECDGLEQINLTVVSENDYAKKLYMSLGFETYGRERNALKFNGQYVDEDLMVLNISNAQDNTSDG
ncbi:GNAT family N-acetyltransferase [Paenibacillus sp. N3.4]|uniref:GNAT family N-acetyltransferase n=1 Tax=Paenibacillus sp. N3.4 TaxID=2603222 RepID=UPI0011C81909|nr:GNAT family protein [Paenibacillus sp. N3.4]TXK71676.1 GNAT family N-acetyltransferase [Paenibacillus sp. N3.4]TXK71688.1 GNAT family N-acetyltransferase [Paenibacillus sp. N3.4]